MCFIFFTSVYDVRELAMYNAVWQSSMGIILLLVVSTL